MKATIALLDHDRNILISLEEIHKKEFINFDNRKNTPELVGAPIRR